MINRKPNQAPLCLALAILAILGLVAPALATYSLVWSDEFSGNGLNTANWNIDLGNGCPNLCGWGNNELEYYRAENVSVAGGNLVLTARAEYYGGAQFTSGKINSKNKQSFLYGRIEMRAKLPTGGGMWPAFWMMPEDDVYGGWAASGEIDIMEAANNTTTVGGTLHFGGSWPDNASTGASYSLGGANFADTFHTYAVEWEPDIMRWYVDSVLFSTKVSAQWYSDAAPGNPLAPFDQDFYIILNAAVGGNYTGCTTASCITADLPQQYLIDYVRVYQDIANIAPAVAITSPATGDNPAAGDIAITATASDADGVVQRVEFYDGPTLLGADTTAPYTFTWQGVPAGCYTLTAKAIDDLGGPGTDTVDITVGAGCGQGPYAGSPFVLPTRLEAEAFDVGGEGVAYHDASSGNAGFQYRPDESVDIEVCSDIGAGYNVGWIDPGEWLEYTVNVPVAGQYDFEARVSSVIGGGTFHIDFNGVDETGDISVPATGGWQIWRDVAATVNLAAGTQVMRFTPTTSGFNVNYFDLQTTVSAVLPDLNTTGYALHASYPNPSNPLTTISYDLPVATTVSLVVYDVAGRLVQTLVAGENMGPGRHESVWRGRNAAGQAAAAGVYFYRLDAGRYSQTRSMTLVK